MPRLPPLAMGTSVHICAHRASQGTPGESGHTAVCLRNQHTCAHRANQGTPDESGHAAICLRGVHILLDASPMPGRKEFPTKRPPRGAYLRASGDRGCSPEGIGGQDSERETPQGCLP